MWDVTDIWYNLCIRRRISTHTSRVGCDHTEINLTSEEIDFYSHIPCGMWLWDSQAPIFYEKNFYSHIPCGMWRDSGAMTPIYYWFLLTHPVWDVTDMMHDGNLSSAISTHTSRVGCDVSLTPSSFLSGISTHTSRVGCDGQPSPSLDYPQISTHTSRVGCDWEPVEPHEHIWISTHTSRVGCDDVQRAGRDFEQFLLTHPVWDVTDSCL